MQMHRGGFGKRNDWREPQEVGPDLAMFSLAAQLSRLK
jgi:hypothetical protein